MRNCIFLKFLAILLCAASLVGMIGGAVGALVLAEGDLYNKTVDEVIDQRVQSIALHAANDLASRYADQTLGGCPPELSRYSRDNLLSWNFTSYGYTILDEEGKVLESLNPELKDSTRTYTIPITGQYMYLVSTQSESQAKEEAARKRMDSITDAEGNTVPAEGISINQVIFTGQDGHVLYEANCNGLTGSSTYFYRDYLLENGVTDSFANTYNDHQSSKTGFLFYNADRQLAYTSFLEEHENPFQATVYGVYFFGGDRSFTFQAEDSQGIGTISNEHGYLLFTSFAAQEPAAEESAPVTAREAIPEVTAETLAEETTEATESAETYAETDAAYQEESREEEETYAEESQEEETYYEENSSEYYETQEEASSASADPEADWTDPDAYQEEAYTGEDYASEEEDAYFQQLYDPMEYRIISEWLIAKGLITEDELPQEMIPDDLFREALVYYELISPEQTFPAVQEDAPAEMPSEEAATAKVNEPVLINGKPLENYQVNQTEYFDNTSGERTTAKYVYLPMPGLTVEVYADLDALTDIATYDALRVLRQFRSYLLPVIGISLVLFILSAVYLCTAAGRSPKTEGVRAGGINRMPLDLYLGLGAFCSIAAIALAFSGVPVLLSREFTLGCALAAVCAFGCGLILAGFLLAFVAQCKTGGGMWWRNMLTIRFVFLFMGCAEKFRRWLAEKGFPRLLGFTKKVWQWIWKILVRLYETVERFAARTGAKLNRFFSLIPMTWQWLLGGLAIILFALLVNTHHILLILLGILVPIAIVLYATHCFGILYESAKRMGKGDLEAKVEDKFMAGCFRDFAKDLNELADVTTEAAQKQLKSERMKTELITNVSHDIKTPLTSIINYVDLLQKPHTEEEKAQYLEVLDRQSQRLKKLVDDLMDMSKASTGNMAVEITRVDMVEAVNQALGEFADKLDRAQLYPVFRHSDASFPIMADGKLVWRVLSNILSNAVKYAMPRTRIYLDLTHVRGQVILSLKNISREELNVTAEELMERFVRGDVSRNTEGSGLGLNIAKSLMELQNGQLQILVDGDLFKVTLIFPDAQ